METAFITPIQPLTLEPGKTSGRVSAKEDTPFLFKDILQDMVKQVKDTQADLEDKQYLLVTGQIDDPHTVPIAAAKAQLSVDLLVSLRNKAVEAYNELMRTSL